MNLRKRVGQNIRAIRKAKGLTLEKLAWGSDLTADFVGNLERGTVNVSIDALERLAKTLDVDPQAFFDQK